jgi:hypothetical protein
MKHDVIDEHAAINSLGGLVTRAPPTTAHKLRVCREKGKKLATRRGYEVNFLTETSLLLHTKVQVMYMLRRLRPPIFSPFSAPPRSLHSIRLFSMASSQLQSLLTAFYRVSDSRCQPEEYAAFFAPDAKLEGFAIGPMALTKSQSGIVDWRKSAWDAVKTREHSVHQVFPKAEDPNEFMILGDLAREGNDGSKAFVTWAGHMKIEPSSQKITYYKVWLVSARRLLSPCWRRRLRGIL